MSEEEESAILAPFQADVEKGKMVEVREIAEAYQAAVSHPVSGGTRKSILQKQSTGVIMKEWESRN